MLLGQLHTQEAEGPDSPRTLGSTNTSEKAQRPSLTRRPAEAARGENAVFSSRWVQDEK